MLPFFRQRSTGSLALSTLSFFCEEKDINKGEEIICYSPLCWRQWWEDWLLQFFSSQHANIITSNTFLSRWLCLLHDRLARISKVRKFFWLSMRWPQVIWVSDLHTEIHTLSFFLAFLRNLYHFPAHCCHHRRKPFKALHCNNMLKIQIFDFIIIRIKVSLSERKPVLRFLCWSCVS